MALVFTEENDNETRHTDDVQDIITAVPSWILRWGITLFFIVLVLLIGLSALIRYPDIVKVTLKVVPSNSPKPIVANLSGKLIKILVHNNEQVIAGQPLAFIQSNVDHVTAMRLLAGLIMLKKQLVINQPVINNTIFSVDYTSLGELQTDYQLFLKEYILYKSSLEKRIYGKTRYLPPQKPMDNSSVKETALSSQNTPRKAKLSEALNSLISKVEDWESKYVLTASQSGKISFAGIMGLNQLLTANQEVFYISTGNEQFFGQIALTQNGMGKIKEGQQVLIKLKSYPFEEYGMIRGKISHISDIADKDGSFLCRVDFKVTKSTDENKRIYLKSGMIADAEIITQDATIFQRLSRNVVKAIGYN